MTTRRGFLAALGAAVAGGGCRSFYTGKAGDFDESLMVFLADIHVQPGEQCEQWQKVRAMGHVAEILRMEPLPRNVLCFGDLAYGYGKVADYEVFREIMQPLEDAGIRLTLGMGNHDCREPFLELFPEYAARLKVKERIVSVVETPLADFVMLDTLNQTPVKPGVNRNMGDGVMDGAQLEWFKDFCAKSGKPIFAGAHHPAREMSNLSVALAEAPTVYGYIHGHNHRWYEYYASDRYKTSRTVQTMGLPSTGHWGDIGYALLRLSAQQARLTCRQTDFFFPNPFISERMTANWAQRVRQHDGQTITFAYDK